MEIDPTFLVFVVLFNEIGHPNLIVQFRENIQKITIS